MYFSPSRSFALSLACSHALSFCSVGRGRRALTRALRHVLVAVHRLVPDPGLVLPVLRERETGKGQICLPTPQNLKTLIIWGHIQRSG